MYGRKWLREDGRKADEMRPVEIECGVVPSQTEALTSSGARTKQLPLYMGQWRLIQERFNAKIERF